MFHVQVLPRIGPKELSMDTKLSQVLLTWCQRWPSYCMKHFNLTDMFLCTRKTSVMATTVQYMTWVAYANQVL